MKLSKSLDGALILAAFAILLFIVWGIYAFKRPLYYEGFMGLASLLKAHTLLQEIFFAPVIPSRVLITLPAVLLHHSGAPAHLNQIVFGAVIFLEGVTVYLLCRRTLMASRLVAFCGGAFAITSTTDYTFNDAAMSAVYLSVLYFLVALLLLVAWVKDPSRRKLIWSCFFLNLSLFTYECALPGILVGPLSILIACTNEERRRRAATGGFAWAIASAPFLAFYAWSLAAPSHYLRGQGLPPMTAADHLRTTVQLFSIHLKPWLWGPERPPLIYMPRIQPGSVLHSQALLALGGAAVFALVALWLCHRERPAEASQAGWSVWRWVMGLLVLALLSSAMFARVQLSDVHYRTQLLSGMLFAVIDAAVIGALWTQLKIKGLAILLAAGLVFAGLRGGLERQEHFTVYSRSQAAQLRSILERAPTLKKHARLVLRWQPGGSNFLATDARYLARSAMGYLYQDTSVEGRIFLIDARKQLQCSLAGPDKLACDDGEWCPGRACSKTVFPLSALVLFSYQPGTNSYLLEERLTRALFPDATDAQLDAANQNYAPASMIVPGPINPYAKEILWFGGT